MNCRTAEVKRTFVSAHGFVGQVQVDASSLLTLIRALGGDGAPGRQGRGSRSLKDATVYTLYSSELVNTPGRVLAGPSYQARIVMIRGSVSA